MAECRMMAEGKYCVCSDCGRRVLHTECNKIRANCSAKQSLFCSHLDSATGDSIRVFDCGCPADSGNGIMASIFSCDLHGQCVLLGDPRDDTIHRCDKCPDRS